MRKPIFFVLLAARCWLEIGAAPASSTLLVPGLSQPVEILRDR